MMLVTAAAMLRQRPESIADALARGEAVDGSVMRPTTDGTLRLIHVRASPILRSERRVGWLDRVKSAGWWQRITCPHRQ